MKTVHGYVLKLAAKILQEGSMSSYEMHISELKTDRTNKTLKALLKPLDKIRIVVSIVRIDCHRVLLILFLPMALNKFYQLLIQHRCYSSYFRLFELLHVGNA